MRAVSTRTNYWDISERECQCQHEVVVENTGYGEFRGCEPICDINSLRFIRGERQRSATAQKKCVTRRGLSSGRVWRRAWGSWGGLEVNYSLRVVKKPVQGTMQDPHIPVICQLQPFEAETQMNSLHHREQVTECVTACPVLLGQTDTERTYYCLFRSFPFLLLEIEPEFF